MKSFFFKYTESSRNYSSKHFISFLCITCSLATTRTSDTLMHLWRQVTSPYFQTFLLSMYLKDPAAAISTYYSYLRKAGLTIILQKSSKNTLLETKTRTWPAQITTHHTSTWTQRSSCYEKSQSSAQVPEAVTRMSCTQVNCQQIVSTNKEHITIVGHGQGRCVA
jgi:hypothetical protein